MLLAIDPDLFEASLLHTESRRAMEWLTNNMADLEFAIDKQNLLLKEYADFLERNINRKEHLAIAFLNDLLSWPREKLPKLDSIRSSDIQDLIDHRVCNEPVEPTLIGMGEHAPTLGLTILLTHRAAKIRKRGLHDPKICQEFCKRLHKLKVAYADTKISMPSLEIESKTEKDLWFEDKMRLITAQIFDGRPRQKTPPPVEMALGGKGADVDVYVCKTQDKRRDIWIGECKLYKMNESQRVEVKKIQQLEKRKPIVSEYECTKGFAETELNIHSIMISNAVDMTTEAWELANEIGAIFWQVKLSEEWRQREHWNIEYVHEYAPAHPSDERLYWHGRFVRTIFIE